MRNTHFDPAYIKAMIKEISIFPLDSFVQLNNGEIGKVIETSYSHPMRPKINVLYGPNGEKKETFFQD